MQISFFIIYNYKIITKILFFTKISIIFTKKINVCRVCYNIFEIFLKINIIIILIFAIVNGLYYNYTTKML